jgi:hypothetical protein
MVHDDKPVKAPADPAKHRVHDESPDALKLPCSQAKQEEEAVVELVVPAGHNTQLDCPEPLIKDPAKQEEHALDPTIDE